MYKVSDQDWLKSHERLLQWRSTRPKSASKVGIDAYTRSIKLVEIPEDSFVLDVGCGDAIMESIIPCKVHYVGIDPFPVNPVKTINGEVICCKVEDMPFSDETFDYVLCFASIFHFQDLEKSMKEMSRVLKKTGVLALQTMINAHSNNHTFNITHELLADLFKLAGLVKRRKYYFEDIPSYLYIGGRK